MPITVTKQKATWDKVLKSLEKSLKNDMHNYRIFYADLKLIDINEDSLKILAPSLLVKTYLSTQDQSHLLNETIKNVLGKDYNLSFYLQDELDETVTKPTKKVSSNVQPVENVNYFSNCKLNSKYIFDSFVVGPCNKEAATAALMVANDPGKLFNPLFIYSKSGLGKTHLLHAIGNYYQEKHPNAHVLYITTDAFIDEFVKYVHGSQDNQSLKDFFKTVDLLLVDDIQFLFGKEKSSEMFFHIFNEIINNNHQIVITSDKMPDELQGIEERLISRFKSGLSFGIDPPEFETAKAILEKKIENLGNTDLVITDDVLDFMVMNYCNDIRSLEGQLKRLFFCSIMESTNYIDMNFASEVFKDQKTIKKAQEPLTKEFILKTTAEFYYLTISQIISKNRTRNLVTPREICMYLMRELLDITFSEIGTTFSNRDHSTVMKACKRVETKIKKDPDYKLAVDKLKQKLGTM